jgi:hypothetical protein
MNYRAQHRVRRAAVRVKVSNGFPVLGGRLGEFQLQIEATNTGERPVVLEAAGFKLPRNGETLALIDPPLQTLPAFPSELAPHRSGMLAQDMTDIAGSLAQHGYVGRVRLVGFFCDQEDIEYLAKPWDFDINEWAPAGWVAGSSTKCLGQSEGRDVRFLTTHIRPAGQGAPADVSRLERELEVALPELRNRHRPQRSGARTGQQEEASRLPSPHLILPLSFSDSKHMPQVHVRCPPVDKPATD